MVAQLLELLGKSFEFDGGQVVRRPEVFETATRDLWEVFAYLHGRLTDEVTNPAMEERTESYFETMATMAREARA